ncbi:hypothetical protein [Rhizobium tropici]|uniref:hypothetical protein n=1 Tax=Rhizobium tropici TaxID=398 RepID=UPI00165F4BFD|nr:hypothetical protein [Rhizobium tropici]
MLQAALERARAILGELKATFHALIRALFDAQALAGEVVGILGDGGDRDHV